MYRMFFPYVRVSLRSRTNTFLKTIDELYSEYDPFSVPYTDKQMSQYDRASRL